MSGADQLPIILPSGECFFHYCQNASYKGSVLFCSKAQNEILAMHRCPEGLWVKNSDGFPVNKAPSDD
jgi:hypothetical protein